jgi:HTH-type transcriptional regulator, competence development regulator
MHFINIKSFGQLIRDQREAKGYPLRKVAAALEIDQAILCKIELGQRNANESYIKPLSALLDIDENQLLVSLQVEQILQVVHFDTIGLAALELVAAEVKAFIHKSAHREYQLDKMRAVFRNFQRVTKAFAYDLGDPHTEPYDRKLLRFAVEIDHKYTGVYSLSELQRSLQSTLNKPTNVEYLETLHPETLSQLRPVMELIYHRTDVQVDKVLML